MFSRYPKFKSCEVAWLSGLPGHWEVCRLGQIGKFSKGKGTNKGDEASSGIPCIRYGDLYTTHQYFISKSRTFVSPTQANQYTRIKYGDVLLAGSGETLEEIGKSAVNLIESNAYCGSDIIIFRPEREVEYRFIGYAMDCHLAASQKAVMGKGITVMHIYRTQLKYLMLALPPIAEQAAIANFLDYWTNKINLILSRKKILIERLKEKKIATISHFTTNGLPPDIALQLGIKTCTISKPSGVNWLGNVPSHWAVKEIKRVSIVQRGASPRPIDNEIYFDENGEYAWVRIADVSAAGMYLRKTTQRLSKIGQSLSVSLRPGSLFLSIAGSVGKPCITTIKCCIHDGFVYFPLWYGDSRFLYYLFASEQPYKGLGKLGTQLNLNTDTVGSIVAGFPPLAEQHAIADILDRETARLDAVITKVEAAIKRLCEYRTALVTAAVTGMIDVRQIENPVVDNGKTDREGKDPSEPDITSSIVDSKQIEEP